MAREKLSALIWWLNSAYKDIIDLSTLPKTQRCFDSISTLVWNEYQTGNKIKAQAKILAIHEDPAFLERIPVTAEGEINDPGNKIFTKEIIDEKKSMDQKNKVQKGLKKAHKRKMENTIQNDCSIAPICNGLPQKKPLCNTQFRKNTQLEQPISGLQPQQKLNAAQPLSFINSGSSAPTCEENDGTLEKGTRQQKNFIIDDELDSTSTSSNNESDDDVLSDVENCEGAARAMSATISGKVKRRDIAFHERLLAAMKHQYEMSHKTNRKSGKTFKVPAHYLQPASNMREISPSCRFYLPEDILAYINITAENTAKVGETEKWRIITREVLLEVYGNTLANYSATGKRGGRQSINPMLFKGLFEWANRASAGVISKNQFISHINKTATNKRKYKNRKTSTSVASSSSRGTGHKSSNTRTPVTKGTHGESSRTAFNSKDQCATEELRLPDKQMSRGLENAPIFETGQEAGLVSDVWSSGGHVSYFESTRAPHYMDSTRRFHSSDSTRVSCTDPTRAPYYDQHRIPAFQENQDSEKQLMQL